MKKNELKDLLRIAQEKQMEAQKCAVNIHYAPGACVRMFVSLHVGEFHKYFKRFVLSTEFTKDENSEVFNSFLSLYSKYEYGNPTESDYDTDFRDLLKISKHLHHGKQTTTKED